jgi:hypothetical protein
MENIFFFYFLDKLDALLSSTGLVRITANGDVTFSGFSLINAGGESNGGDSGDGLTNVGIYTESSSTGLTYTIINNSIEGTNDANDEQDYGFYSNGGKEKIVFQYNTISLTGANSILLEKHTGATDISYNNLDIGIFGIDAIFAMTYGGVDITSLQNISNNHFDMDSGSNLGGATAVTIASSYNEGTLGDGKFTNVRISNNVIDEMNGNRRGITFWNGDETDGAGGEITGIIYNNTIIGANISGSRGISLLGKTTNVNIINNTISDLWRNIWVTDSVTAGVHYSEGTVIKYNRILDGGAGLIWDGSTLLDAENNYWGACDGPSVGGNGTGSSVSGNVDFVPWIGACISNESVSSQCVVVNDDVKLTSNVSGSCISNVFFSVFNGTWNNYTASLIGGNYTVTLNDISPSGTVDWKVNAVDCLGNIETGSVQNFQVHSLTNLAISPSVPDGLSDWYVTVPTFTLTNVDSVATYYRWVDDIFTYSGPFQLENTPNNESDSGGTLNLRYWSNFSCGSEISNNKTIKVDITSPRINIVHPLNNSIILNTSRPVIEANIDELYQSNSGIDITSLQMYLDNSLVSGTITVVNNNKIKVKFTPLSDLAIGDHNASISVNDKAGRNSELFWMFNINETGTIVLSLNEPNDSLYATKRIPVNLTVNDIVDSISYINYNSPNPRWTTLCTNCNNYGENRKRLINFFEGSNEVVFRAVDGTNSDELNVSFVIDSVAPKIQTVFPPRNGYSNGSEFRVKYTEDNLNSVRLIINATTMMNVSLNNCASGRNVECSIQLNLSSIEGEKAQFYFEVSDIVSTVKSKPTTFYADSIVPVINITKPVNGTLYGKKIGINISSSEKVTLELLDSLDTSQTWKALCSNCDSYGKNSLKTRSFIKGNHTLYIRATDYSGNRDIKSVSFESS